MAEELEIISDEDLKAPLEMAKNYEALAGMFDSVVASMTKLTASLDENTGTLKEQKDASDKLGKAQKDLDNANKKATDSQKSFASATDLANDATGGLIGKVKSLGKSLMTLAATPVGAVLLVIAGALAAIGTYFKKTNEGADKFEKILNSFKGVVDFLTNKFAALGEQLVLMFEDGNVLGEFFIAIFDQVINRIAGAIDFFTNLIKILNIITKYNLKDILTGNLKPEDLKALKTAVTDMGKAFVQAYTGIGDAAEQAKTKVEALNALTEAGQKLGDETRDRILSKAQALLDIEKQIFIFKDKANHTDQERVDALKQAVKISEEQLKIDIDLATRKERQFTAELLAEKDIIKTEEEANKVLSQGTTILQDQLLEQKASDEQLEERRKLQADVINLQRDFFAENKKNIAQIGALQKEIDDAAIARAEKEVAARLRIFDAQLKAAKETSGAEIVGLKNSLGMQEDITKRFNQRLVDETKLRLDAQKKAEEEYQKNLTKMLQQQEEQRRAIAQATIQAAGMLGNEFFAREQEKLNEASKLSEERRAKELAGVGDDERKKLAINRKYDREQAKIKQKQAQADKQAALFNILISTAMGIARVAPNPVLIALVAAIGAIQAAIVVSKPLPKFWTGTKNSPDTFIAGDQGRELISYNGKSFVAERPTIFSGMEGARVFSNRESEEILGNMDDVGHALSYGSKVKNKILSGNTEYQLRESNRWLKRIAMKPDVGLIVDEEGFHQFTNKVNRRNARIAKRFLGR